MEEPQVTDWISAGAAVVQTVGALLAIWLTARIARRGERDAARREREALEREEAARTAANARADAAIEQAARSELERTLAARRRIAEIAAQAIGEAMTDCESQAVSADRTFDALDNLSSPSYSIDPTVLNTAAVTLDALLRQSDDPMVSTLLAQGLESLKPPPNLFNWDPPAAAKLLRTRQSTLQEIRAGLRAA